jgi:hypothetical protein
LYSMLFYFLITFSYKPIITLFFSLLYNAIKNFITLNIECFYYCNIIVPALCVCVCVCSVKDI